MSTLSELRTEFKYWTGRQDLSDARIDMLIKAGQTFLDTMRVLPQRRVLKTSTPDAGTYEVTLTGLLSLHRVELLDSNDHHLEPPTKYEYENFITTYRTYATASQGLPNKYTLWFPDSTVTADTTVLLFTPKFNGTYKLMYLADLKQPTLVADDDTNVWSEEYEDILLDAAAMVHEGKMRNTEGVRDFTNIVRLRTTGLDSQSADMEDPGWGVLQG